MYDVPSKKQTGLKLRSACCSLMVFGLLNLIVAAIVDANIAAREEDIAGSAAIAAQEQLEAT